MKCPYCHREDTQVTDSRLTPDGSAVKRRRKCRACGKRFTTYERVERIGLSVVKRDSRREEYNREKLFRSIAVACTKRPISRDQLEEVTNDIEADLFRQGTSEVDATTIGEMVMHRLRALDEVAYIRFASVYRNFADLEEMREAMEGLTDGPIDVLDRDEERGPSEGPSRGKARG